MSRRRAAVAALACALIVAGFAAYLRWIRPMPAMAPIGAGYVASMMSSGVFISQRSPEGEVMIRRRRMTALAFGGVRTFLILRESRCR